MNNTLTAIGGVLLLAGTAFGQTTITFDELGPQPAGFAQTSPLRDQYSYLGVHFSGASTLGGGAILDETGNFGLPPLSGRDFLAFNSVVQAQMANGGFPRGPETVTFDFPVSNVSIYGGSRQTLDFTLSGYDTLGHLLVTTSKDNSPGDYCELSIASPGITSITLNGSGQPYYVFDNLTFSRSSVPDGGLTIAMLGMGFSGLAFIRRKL